MPDQPSSQDRLIDALVHAPIGFALYARDTAPGFARLFVARGRQELERRRSQVDDGVNQARTLGRFAVMLGPPEIKRRVSNGVERVCNLADGVIGTEPVAEGVTWTSPATDAHAGTPASPPSADAAPEDPLPTPEPVPVPPAAPLPIPDYDELSASQVVERLDGLEAPDLDAIETYERARRGRRTILGKIEQLSA